MVPLAGEDGHYVVSLTGSSREPSFTLKLELVVESRVRDRPYAKIR